jgi:tetratricopeptide (TPR) repeat protein
MGIVIAFFLLTVPAFAAEYASVQDKIASLQDRAAKAVQTGQFAAAEEELNEALQACAALPAGSYRVRADVLRGLAELYAKQNKPDKAEWAYKSRVDFLNAQKADGKQPILEIGIALFDLQSLYEATARNEEAREYMERARTFYENCKNGSPDLKAVCDRRLADVEGLHGSELFLQKRYDEAIPFLRAVVDRQDFGVRPEVLYASLAAYSQILANRGQWIVALPLIARARRIKASNPANFPK